MILDMVNMPLQQHQSIHHTAGIDLGIIMALNKDTSIDEKYVNMSVPLNHRCNQFYQYYDDFHLGIAHTFLIFCYKFHLQSIIYKHHLFFVERTKDIHIFLFDNQK